MSTKLTRRSFFKTIGSLISTSLFFPKKAFAQFVPFAFWQQRSSTSNPIFGWGQNFEGPIGDGTLGNKKQTPTATSGSAGWSKVSAGESFTVAIKADNSLYAWGRNNDGNLGNGDDTDQSIPVRIGALNDWSVVESHLHTLAVKTNGTLWSWGLNDQGTIGDGSSVNRSSPVQIGALTNWVSVGAGVSHSLAVKSDGTLWAWGR